jgi:protein SCO1/2
VDGQIVSVDVEGSRVEIAHEDIQGFMPAMTMHFDAASPDILAGLKPGLQVRFDLERRGAQLRVVAIEVLGEGVSGRSGAPAAAPERAPDFELVDQDGRPFRLAEQRGYALLLDFIFTRCPGPCPLVTAAHVAVQRDLAPALAERTRFVSITLDPEYDTPQRMKAYAEARGADLSSWSFLTGEPDRVLDVARAYHVAPSSGLALDHVLATYLIAPDGRIVRRYIGPGQAPADLLRDLEGLLG